MKFQMSVKISHVGSKTRSLSQILEKPCVHSRGQIFSPIIMKPGQNVCRDEISRVPTCQGKVREKWKFLKVREMSGNFDVCQGNLKITAKVREMPGNFEQTVRQFFIGEVVKAKAVSCIFGLNC